MNAHGFVYAVIGKKLGVSTYPATNILLLDRRAVAVADTHINDDPNAERTEAFAGTADGDYGGVDGDRSPPHTFA
ncbi:hypothetical protein [Burkholderia pyrrocinia]|uniref:hypothetical protein n=1 Tax=Burkholderia pyrrocinia TaxID=60550 RepID=UPI00158D07D1|nr:hypothetical protein [Burkholderia pyrrocinia]